MIVACLLILPNTGQASEVCRNAVQAAERQYEIPAELLLAMNQVETLWSNQAWPWSLNISGKPQRYKTDTEMTNALDEVVRRTENVDIGCMQINWRWVGKECATDPRDLVNPQSNAICSARYLTKLYRQLGSWHKAVKAYHVGPFRKDKGANQRADSYVCKVGREYALLLGKEDPC
ncbi:MAG: transglycosylase SLT domain-containing protein [Thalassospira sp.]|uniref:transglycosylase SLT domain-containing protein n=1 Tax=Thalassospira sp. TaxID=1912094 RepID=UPI0032EB7186